MLVLFSFLPTVKVEDGDASAKAKKEYEKAKKEYEKAKKKFQQLIKKQETLLRGAINKRRKGLN